MKRIMFLLSIAAIAVMATSCNNTDTLVAYFSATGTTKALAERIAETAGADLFEIQPAALYTEADLNWRDSLSRSSVEMSDKTSRPAIAGKVPNIGKYTTVYIGFPIWWYTAPTIINTFIEENDLAGKTVKFFATSGSSDIANAVNEFSAAYPEINWNGGKLLNFASEDDIAMFLERYDEVTPECGGYSEQRKPTKEEIAMFRKAFGDGPEFCPLSVSVQVVAGFNYRFWCSVSSKGRDEHCWVNIYKPIDGDPEFVSLERDR